MDKKYLIIIVLLFSPNLQSQDNGRVINNMFTTNLISKSFKTNFNSNIEKDVFLFEKWNTKGYIFSDQKKFKLEKLNYSLKNKTFSFRYHKDSVFTFSNSSVDSVVINNKLFKKDIDLNEKANFFEILYSDNFFHLYKKYKYKFIKGKLNPITGKTSKGKYQVKVDYFITNNKLTKKIKLNKRYFLNLFGDKEKKVSTYLNKNKLKFKKEKDLVKILKYFSSLR